MALSMFENYDNSSTSNMLDCCKNYLIIGTTTDHSFSIDLETETIKKIIVSYSQILDGNNIVVLEKEFDGSAIDTETKTLTFNLSEEDTLLFHPEVDAIIQIKVALKNNSVLVSNKFYLEVLNNNNQATLVSGPIEDIQIRVVGRSISIHKFLLIAGSENSYRCNFSVDSAWDGLTLKAVFKNTLYNSLATVDLDEDNSCLIPNDIISSPCRLAISLVGSNDNLLKSTEWSNTLLVIDSSLSKSIIEGDE